MQISYKLAPYDGEAVKRLAELLLPLDKENPARLDCTPDHAGATDSKADHGNHTTRQRLTTDAAQ